MAVLNNTVTTTDVAPAISVDLVSQLTSDIRALQEVLGVNSLIPMSDGAIVKIYNATVTLANQVAEGDEIELSDVSYTETPVTVGLKKFRKLVTAEAIQKVGRERAIYDTDRALLGEIRGTVTSDFYTQLATGTGTTPSGATLQETLANAWAALHVFYDNYDVNPVHFVNPLDVADYLGSAQITTQTAFGFDYARDFLGLGTVVFSPRVTQGTVISTAQENLRGAFVPSNSSVGLEFDLTADETGMVGITHGRNLGRASIETLMLSGITFFAENAAGVFKGTVTP